MAKRLKPDAVKVNRVGYLPWDVKTAYFRMDSTQTSFRVKDAGGNVVFRGEITRVVESETSGEQTGSGDFSGLSQSGVFCVETDSLGHSCWFAIGKRAYQNVFRALNRMFYLQRCGVALSANYAGVFAHPACHRGFAREIGSGRQRDVSGGWHDAGDYGRYVVPAAKAVMDLLLAYCHAPDAFSDDMGIPESGNGLPDVLDEVRFELEWMLKMQAPDRGVNHKVTCAEFPEFVMPQEETDALLLSPVSTCATADCCGTLAFASRVYAPVDATFASACLRAAISAYAYLEQTPSSVFINPSGIVTGQYEDANDVDERYFAACALFYATGEERYHDAARERANPAFVDGLGWDDMGAYGNAIYRMTESAKTDPALRKTIESELLAAADRLVARCEQDGYRSSLLEFRWGSNMYLLNNAILLLMANDIRPSEAYRRAAAAQADVVFGTNPMSISYVTGHGDACPKHPHHRPSAARKRAMPGMLVGGPNERLQDDYAREHLKDAPPAQCYADDLRSYSTNEVAIYWNAPLIYVLARLGRA